MKTIVQISLDVPFRRRLRRPRWLCARVDWLEAGTPLILAEGTRGVRALREAHPNVSIECDTENRKPALARVFPFA